MCVCMCVCVVVPLSLLEPVFQSEVISTSLPLLQASTIRLLPVFSIIYSRHELTHVEIKPHRAQTKPLLNTVQLHFSDHTRKKLAHATVALGRCEVTLHVDSAQIESLRKTRIKGVT